MVAAESPCKFTIMSDNVLSPSRRRSGTGGLARRPLSNISNSSMAQSPAAKPLAKLEPAKQQPVNNVVVEEPVAAAADVTKNASASRRASTGAIVAGVLGAVAIAGLICGLSMGGNSSLSSSKAPAAMTAEAQPKWEAPALDVLSEMREVMSEMGDNTEGSVAQVLDESAEAVGEHEEEFVEEDWSEFSPGHEDLFDAEDDTAEGEGEDQMPWDQSTIAGPVHLDANLISDGIDASLVSGDHTSLFARLAGNGELFLFAEAESALPVAMLAIDGCAHVMNSAQALRDSCFAIHTMAGRTGAGCVVDAEEAQDWAAALGQSPCD